MQKTKIEYLTHTWNPIAMRCTPFSSGCDHCWHLTMANRLGGNDAFDERTRDAYNLGIPWLRDKELSAPLRLRTPSIIGVQFMGDLFHEKVSNEMIAAVFGVMAACPKHTFVVLTKRPERALKWFAWCSENQDVVVAEWYDKTGPYPLSEEWPLQNVMFGVSIEDQKTADERIPLLLQIPAAKRFVSAEPLLGEVRLDEIHLRDDFLYTDENPTLLNAFNDMTWMSETCIYPPDKEGRPNGINLVICGAETGPGKRPMNLEWARSLRDQCAEAGVSFFFKKDSEGNHTLDGVVHEEMPG